MKQEEINKAAEEARRETAIQARSDWHHSLDGVSLDVSIDELVESAFAGGAEWVLSQPLCNRLSDIEKDRIREIYRVGVESREHYHKQIKIATNAESKKLLEILFNEHNSRLNLLISIFGKDLFTDNTEL